MSTAQNTPLSIEGASEKIAEFIEGFAAKYKRDPMKDTEQIEAAIMQLYESIDYANRIAAGRAISTKVDQQTLARVHQYRGIQALIKTGKPENILKLICMQYFRVSKTLRLCVVREKELRYTTKSLKELENKTAKLHKDYGRDAANKQKPTYDFVLDFAIIAFIDKLNADNIF